MPSSGRGNGKRGSPRLGRVRLSETKAYDNPGWYMTLITYMGALGPHSDPTVREAATVLRQLAHEAAATAETLENVL